MTLASKDNPGLNFNPINAVDLAAAKITPTWPLDQSIAVNPWWQLRAMGIAETAAKLRFLGNIRLLMPKSHYRSLWSTELSEEHLNQAKTHFGVTADTNELLGYLDKPDNDDHWQHISDFLDDQESHQYRISWREEVLQQISSFCAFYLNFPDNFSPELVSKDDFYSAWRTSTIADKGLQILTGESHLNEILIDLPEHTDDLVNQHYNNVSNGGINESAWQDYVYALLLDVNGWASWLAYDEWQADLNGQSHQQLLRQLVVIRMAWDWVLWQNTLLTDQSMFKALSSSFIDQLTNAQTMQLDRQQDTTLLWVWHKATEIKFQQDMQQKLTSAIDYSVNKPILQAVFCIDVRSEQYRKQLEAQNSKIETYGFAGFFGLPIAYTTKAGQNTTPQLPGLLKPNLIAQQAISVAKATEIRAQLNKKLSWKLASDSAASSFGMIESQGLFKVFDLLKQSLFGSSPSTVIAKSDIDIAWQIDNEISTLDAAALASLAKSILGGIGLTSPYAEHVLIVGHGSFSSNNPHASGLDCGACGGQTGEVNALVLCHLLNQADIRAMLNQEGLAIPDNTQFVPCLHNTVTDDIIVLNSQHGQWSSWLEQATIDCQKQRIVSDGNLPKDEQKTQQALAQRTQDWAQLRPEWGLANNAAFVVAPRAFTRGLDFEGRSFLHDYTWQNDHKFDLLELIMTAPMIVTNWINLQYYASVTDNHHYGSGNKMLHNVIDGNFGVFEGNGGDLRIGLPQQSLHDGEKWRHSPIRLNVYIAAPKAAIEDIINKHAMIKDLLENDWLFLFQWDHDTKAIAAYQNGDWQPPTIT